jgi:hypothetical protein
LIKLFFVVCLFFWGRALAMMASFRMTAVMASLVGFPASVRRV